MKKLPQEVETLWNENLDKIEDLVMEGKDYLVILSDGWVDARGMGVINAHSISDLKIKLAQVQTITDPAQELKKQNALTWLILKGGSHE